MWGAAGGSIRFILKIHFCEHDLMMSLKHVVIFWIFSIFSNIKKKELFSSFKINFPSFKKNSIQIYPYFSFLGKQFPSFANLFNLYQIGRSKNSPWSGKPGGIVIKEILCDKWDIWFLLDCFLDIIIKSLFRKANLI